MDDLLPCPFCGHEARMHTADDGPNCVDRYSARVGCIRCGVFVSAHGESTSAVPVSAIAKWNCRPTPTAQE